MTIGGIPSPQPEKCYVCGRTGERRAFLTHRGQRVCLDTYRCMDRVFNPPPPPLSVDDFYRAVARSLNDQTFANFNQLGTAVQGMFQQKPGSAA